METKFDYTKEMVNKLMGKIIYSLSKRSMDDNEILIDENEWKYRYRMSYFFIPANNMFLSNVYKNAQEILYSRMQT